MKYTELVTIINNDKYSLEMDITIDVTFHRDEFIYVLDSVGKVYANGEESTPFETKESLRTISTFIDNYKFNEDAIWAQSKLGEEG